MTFFTKQQREVILGEARSQSISKRTKGFVDPSNQQPIASKVGRPTTNTSEYVGGGRLRQFGEGLPPDTEEGLSATYPYNQVTQTPAGHILEFNNTAGHERILIKHGREQTGINFGPDGSVIISSTRTVHMVGEDYNLSAGDGQLTFNGNLTLNVTGDFNVNVGGEYNVTSLSSSNTIKEDLSTTIYGSKEENISGTDIKTVIGEGSLNYLSGLTTAVKGESVYAVQGAHTLCSSEKLTMTAETEVVMTSPEANIAATNLSVFGDQGTFGGANVIAYVKNIYGTSATFTNGVTAPTFHGDLNGLAKESSTTHHQEYSDPDAGGGVGTDNWESTGVNTATDATASAQPTEDLLSEYIVKGDKGVLIVDIDPDDIIKQVFDYTTKTRGLSSRPLTAQEAREKLKNTSNKENTDFILSMTKDGVISDKYAKKTPDNVRRSLDVNDLTLVGTTRLGNISLEQSMKKVKV